MGEKTSFDGHGQTEVNRELCVKRDNSGASPINNIFLQILLTLR